MIIKENQKIASTNYGVAFEILATGEKSMVTKMLYKMGDSVPEHQHPNEQSGYVVSGKIRLKFQGLNEILVAGDSYSIPADTLHSIEIIERGEVIDVFSPPRLDFLNRK